ncbi:hypothetical protein Tco_0484450 [Tanacetum coccineum]
MDARALRRKDAFKGERPWGDTVCDPWISDRETLKEGKSTGTPLVAVSFSFWMMEKPASYGLKAYRLLFWRKVKTPDTDQGNSPGYISSKGAELEEQSELC